MKRTIAIILISVMTLTISACGAKKDNSEPVTTEQENSTEKTEEEAKEEESTPTENDINEEEMKELSAIGDVEVENGVLTVTITIPAELVGEITQEELDQQKGLLYVSAVLNEDGSVSFKLTKDQYKDMLASFTDDFDVSFQEIVDDDENYTISNITHNEDYTVFDVTVEGNEVGFQDYFTTYTFNMYGEMYGILTGKEPEHIIVNFYDSEGKLIESIDSDDLNEGYENTDSAAAPTLFEDTDDMELMEYGNSVFRFKALQSFVGDDALDQLERLGMPRDNYDQDIENLGGPLVIIEYEITMLRDCTENDLWSLLGEYFREPSASSGSAGEAYTLIYDNRQSLREGDQILAYEIGVLNDSYDEFYSMLYAGDYFFIHHTLNNE